MYNTDCFGFFFKFSFCYILFWYVCLLGWLWKQCALHSPVTPPLDPCTARPRSRFPTSRPPSRHTAFCRARRLGLRAVMQDPIIIYAIFISSAYAFFHYITEQILIYWNNIFFSFKKKRFLEITCGNRVLRRIALLDRILNLITKYSSNLFIFWTYMVNLNFTFFPQKNYIQYRGISSVKKFK